MLCAVSVVRTWRLAPAGRSAMRSSLGTATLPMAPPA